MERILRLMLLHAFCEHEASAGVARVCIVAKRETARDELHHAGARCAHVQGDHRGRLLGNPVDISAANLVGVRLGIGLGERLSRQVGSRVDAAVEQAAGSRMDVVDAAGSLVDRATIPGRGPRRDGDSDVKQGQLEGLSQQICDAARAQGVDAGVQQP